MIRLKSLLKIFLHSLLLPLLAIGCHSLQDSGGNKDKKELIAKTIQEELTLHPQATLIDLYKNFFQGAYGPAHLIENPEAALNYIHREIQAATEYEPELWQKVGYAGQYYRVNLSLVKEGTLSAEELLEALVKSANEAEEPSIESWLKDWDLILAVIEEMKISIPNFEQDKKALENMLERKEVVVHHSPTYFNVYHPHYRLLSKKHFSDLKALVERRRSEKQ